ncbi:acriflavine resistance protein B [Thioclava sp. L04-15]|uniref:efflux RND transporter permease subunit n=1 Tax=Thioclava sp. L04-15 TaxID=1915318 RepID=UPI000998D551|nr:efflux RND transporter permease subunit [Thioclava sp. L04-15]OOY29165.1 acriflavine resistance protein B [Thioclava sp. L04-15]TNE93764.1 MAG: efflux RND transporter permease subunit [Paracoccaceae bacterium]
MAANLDPRELPPARGLIGMFTRHATLANIVLVVMLCAGLIALPRMRAQFFPDSVEESVSVSVTWEGAGAEEVDRAIVQVLEPSLIAVEGVENSESRASEGSARISLDFEPGWDMSRAVNDVENALATAGDLPEGAEEPEVNRGVWRDTVTDLVITGPLSTEQLGRLGDEAVVRLYQQGVTRTALAGIAAPETVVEVPTVSMMAHDVTLTQIINVIAAEAATDPAGDVAGGATRVTTGEERRSAPEIAALVIRTEPDGSQLTVGDVARIHVAGGDRNKAYFVGDHPAVVINVARSAAGDAIAIQKKVQAVVSQMEPTLPAGTTMDLVRTRSDRITQRLDLLVNNGVLGLGLVLALLFLFLNARTAFWVAMGIPTSMAAALAVMYFSGMTLNMISIFALILTLGIVVDDAIVVGEHADFRARHLGEHPTLAAENGARRMAAPVFASTLTTVIAFAGLTVIGGRMGNMIVDIPYTVIAVLLASLVECFVILPNHMSHALRHTSEGKWYDWPSRQVNRGLDWFRRKVMKPLTRAIVTARYPVIAAAIALLLWQVSFVMSGKVQWRFFNPPEQSTVNGSFSMVEGATRADTEAMMRAMQATVTRVAKEFEDEYGVNPVEYAIAQIGGASGRALASADTKGTDLLGSISIEVIDPDYRPYSSFDFVSRLQQETPRLPLVEEISFRRFSMGGAGDGIAVQFSGAETRVLKEAAEDLKTALAQFPEVSAVEDNLAYDKQELVLDLTPQGDALGFDIATLGRELRARLNGTEAASFPDGVRSATIRVELPPEELAADFIDRMQLRTPAGQWVPLADIVSVRSQTGFSTIRREDGVRQVSVTGDVSEDDPARANAILTQVETEILPRIAEERGVAYVMSGQAEQERDFMSDATVGLSMVVIGIYIVLAWIFASWTRPLVVMSVIPFGAVGAIWGHYIWNLPMSMFAVVGGIGMVGIIINDAIVLISTVDEYAERRGIVPAIVDAVSDRLRPVLLTTLTTVLGLAPLLYEQSSSALFLKSTVITLVYGLGFGMVIVLLVVPAMLAIQLDFGRQITAVRHGARVVKLRGILGGVAALLIVALAITLGRAMLTGQAMMPAFGGFALIATMIVLAAGLIAPRLLRGHIRHMAPPEG